MGGDVVPSFLQQDGEAPKGIPFLSDNSLHPGEVQEIIYPSDPRSRSKRVNEYSVYVQIRQNGTAVTKIFPNCVMVNDFAGFADKLTYTLRAEKNADSRNSSKSKIDGKGSKVLILCLNGETNSALIIGGMRDGKDSDPKTDELGHHLHFSFNGVDFDIDKDGQLALTVRGATDAMNVSTNENLPSTLTIDKQGTITAATKEGKDSIVIEHGKITVTSDSEIEVNTKTAKVTADKVSIVSDQIELGSEGIYGVPAAGVVLGHHIDSFTGAPFFALGATSQKVFGKK